MRTSRQGNHFTYLIGLEALGLTHRGQKRKIKSVEGFLRRLAERQAEGSEIALFAPTQEEKHGVDHAHIDMYRDKYPDQHHQNATTKYQGYRHQGGQSKKLSEALLRGA